MYKRRSPYGAPATNPDVGPQPSGNPTAGDAAPTEQTQSASLANGGRAAIESPPARRPHSKTLHDQVREVYRLVEDATDSLEQVLRAIRFIEKDL